MPESKNRFMQAGDVRRERDPWATVEWLCREDLVEAEQLLLVRATIAAGRSHPFHRHPNREEIIYVISGQAEQWVEDEYRILQAGEMALIPQNVVHGTYNPFDEDVTFLAILAPSDAPGPDIVDVSTEETWAAMRKDRPPTK
ncbi:MAG: cupin domain-containing protein [Roseibacillus sp.]|nr:cupin domain-containing protein [Roseibacillus sp.]MDP7307643.1 cupin domain-containing protein [Roseibacillus sp.]MDP7656658.1 cupin domain-containing protein [Roseibacillus sp.]HJM62319.1 cupin domain-containing protein [Roseibacillus sp.]